MNNQARINTNVDTNGKLCNVKSFSHYLMSKALPLLLLKGVAKGGHKLVQFFSMAAQEFPHILDILQTVRDRNSTQLLCKS